MSASHTPAGEAAHAARHKFISQFLNLSEVDGRVLGLFSDKALRNKLAHQGQVKINFDKIWEESCAHLLKSRQLKKKPRSNPIDTHNQVVEGLLGMSMFIAAAMVWDNLDQAGEFYDVTAKTLRSRWNDTLTVHEGELALRAGRVTEAAANVLGDYDSARHWIRARNFALGGVSPRELLKTAEGERIVLNELQTQSESGPL